MAIGLQPHSVSFVLRLKARRGQKLCSASPVQTLRAVATCWSDARILGAVQKKEKIGQSITIARAPLSQPKDLVDCLTGCWSCVWSCQQLDVNHPIFGFTGALLPYFWRESRPFLNAGVADMLHEDTPEEGDARVKRLIRRPGLV